MLTKGQPHARTEGVCAHQMRFAAR